MTPRPPAKLIGFFARSAPVCVIIRRGPSGYSQMVMWNTETDEFTPGQWIRGRVTNASLSSDGRFMALAISNARKRDVDYVCEISTICKPPYFTALEVWLGCYWFDAPRFLEDDTIAYPEGCEHVVNAKGPCPFKHVARESLPPQELPAAPDIFGQETAVFEGWGSGTGIDQQGREIWASGGRVFARAGGEERMLFDANPYEFEPIEAPDWAKDWGS
jgi:hypothetical protein